MAGNLDRRIDKLERDAAVTATAIVWRNMGETQAAALARRFPDGPPDGAAVLTIGWLESQSEDVRPAALLQ
jgi:hypothetical protein